MALREEFEYVAYRSQYMYILQSLSYVEDLNTFFQVLLLLLLEPGKEATTRCPKVTF